MILYLAGVGLLYTAVLFLKNYSTYVDLGIPLALQGRYILPVLPLLLLLTFAIYDGLLKAEWLRKTFLFLGVITLLTSGLVSYILLSDSSWYFENQKVTEVNQTARDALSPINFIVID